MFLDPMIKSLAVNECARVQSRISVGPACRVRQKGPKLTIVRDPVRSDYLSGVAAGEDETVSPEAFKCNCISLLTWSNECCNAYLFAKDIAASNKEPQHAFRDIEEGTAGFATAMPQKSASGIRVADLSILLKCISMTRGFHQLQWTSIQSEARKTSRKSFH